MRLHDGSVRIVAHPAFLEHHRLMRMNLGKSIALVAIETATFKNKTSTLICAMALGTLDACNRRMLPERLETGGRIRAGEELHFLLPAFPRQNQRMLAGGSLQSSVKHAGKGLVDLEHGAVQKELPVRRRSDHVNLSCVQRGMIRRSENLPEFIIRRRHLSARQSYGSGKGKPGRQLDGPPTQNETLRLS